MAYYLGKLIQAIALVLMPMAIWSAEIDRSEAKSIGFFAGCTIIFFCAGLLTRGVKQ